MSTHIKSAVACPRMQLTPNLSQITFKHKPSPPDHTCIHSPVKMVPSTIRFTLQHNVLTPFDCCSAGFHYDFYMRKQRLEIRNAWIYNTNAQRSEDSLGRQISLASAPPQTTVNDLRQYSSAFYCADKQKPGWQVSDIHSNGERTQ